MLLLKAFHLAALVCWCGGLLYLPALISAGAAGTAALESEGRRSARRLFVALVTPAALLAILSGTLLFMLQGSVALWLAAKLAAVAGIVLCHSACGALIGKVEREEGTGGSCGRRCGALVILIAAFIGAALWLVLAKPF
jgi:uncharacterized membrane protein